MESLHRTSHFLPFTFSARNQLQIVVPFGFTLSLQWPVSVEQKIRVSKLRKSSLFNVKNLPVLFFNLKKFNFFKRYQKITLKHFSTMHQTIEESRKRADSKKRPFQHKDQKPPIPPQTTDSNRNTNGDTSKHGSVSSIVRSPSISSNSISSSNQKTGKNGNEKEENGEKPKNGTTTKR